MGKYEKTREILYKWFQKATNWQRELFCAIWNGANNENELVEHTIKQIEKEYSNQNSSSSIPFPSSIDFSNDSGALIMLDSISDIKGVGALEAHSPLEFGTGITVIYGENGCGKSSYVKILKAAENPAYSKVIIGNVFSKKDAVAPSANITLSVDGEKHQLRWSKANTQKYPILIYDTDIAHQFVDKETEVLYEPKLLSVVSKMAKVYTQLLEYYKDTYVEVEKLFTEKSKEIDDNPIISSFMQLASLKSIDEFADKHPWNESLKAELVAISESLQVSNPDKRAQALHAQKEIIQGHKNIILKLLPLISAKGCEAYIRKRDRQIAAKRMADQLAKEVQFKSKLGGFGSENWKLMWQSATNFIRENKSVDAVQIPVSGDNRCALCQQTLDEDAKERLYAFDKYVSSQVIQESAVASQDFTILVRRLQNEIENGINLLQIKTSLTSSAISDNIQMFILKTYGDILNKGIWLLSYGISDEEGKAPLVQAEDEIAAEFNRIDNILVTQIEALHHTAQNRETQINRRNELLAIQWISENLQVRKQLCKLTAIQSKCKTNSLTTLKKDLSDLLITNAYIERFSQEMSQLDLEKRIKVELVSKGAKQGRSYHQISLKGISQTEKAKTGDILSEGEYRVVSLAAFLADLSSWGKRMPFIFDDPITSLDHKFEERVAQRLIRLSTERQVIVFTHRLAFAQFLDVNVKQYNATYGTRDNSAIIRHIELRVSPLGEPTSPSYIENINLKKQINNMLSEDIARIRKAQVSEDPHGADIAMQALCTKFRNLVERGIEQVLLSGIVMRFNRNISTLKLPRLYAITQEDIFIFDSMMTKYSAYDHSHSVETPVNLPSVEAIEKDLKKMGEWADDFEKRCKTAENKAKGKL